VSAHLAGDDRENLRCGAVHNQMKQTRQTSSGGFRAQNSLFLPFCLLHD
jgi:hypothetical protein